MTGPATGAGGAEEAGGAEGTAGTGGANVGGAIAVTIGGAACGGAPQSQGGPREARERLGSGVEGPASPVTGGTAGGTC